ncbi:trypsin-like peptidase domain-containing protein [Candidatus Woesearchaeota archaeon]|nr:trypsin-like peptidase domain-containing protein [Candidatus Woesearchaeota archaeon]
MDKHTRFTLINLGIITLFAISMLIFNYQNTKDLKEEFKQQTTTIQQSIDQTKQDITGQITTLKTSVAQADQKLEEKITGSITSVEKQIDTTKKQQEQALQTLTTQLDQNNQRISTFEDQLKNINIKNKDFTNIIQDTLKAVVTIKTDKGIGSGVIINPKGYIVTNYHVLDGATQAGLKTYDQRTYAIKVIGTEKNSDIAVLKIEPTLTLKALSFEITNIHIGDNVIAVGNPAGLEFSVTEGIISATDRKGNNGVTYLQTDVPINPGNSGGPLVNIHGKIVGINTMKRNDMEGLGFAIHADNVERITEEIIKQYEGQQNQ